MFLASWARHLAWATTPGGMWHDVHDTPLCTESAHVFSAGCMALQDEQ